jgi:hypothetical protein
MNEDWMPKPALKETNDVPGRRHSVVKGLA